MKIYSKDSLKIGEYGFVRDLHPAFNVSDNIFGHKSSYTRHLYYSLRDSKIKSVFFKEGVLNGRIIKKHNGSIDFIVSDFEGIAYLIKNKTKGTLITDSNLLNGHIIFNINNHLYENVDWVNSIQWDDSKNQNRGPDYPGVVWESEDDPLDMEPREASIETLSSDVKNYLGLTLPIEEWTKEDGIIEKEIISRLIEFSLLIKGLISITGIVSKFSFFFKAISIYKSEKLNYCILVGAVNIFLIKCIGKKNKTSNMKFISQVFLSIISIGFIIKPSPSFLFFGRTSKFIGPIVLRRFITVL